MEKSLSKYRASLNETDTLCWVTSSNDETAKLLEMMQYLDVGVNFNHMKRIPPPSNAYINYSLGTALQYAVKSRDLRRSELLLACGADWNLKSVKGFTPLEIFTRYR